MLHTRICDLLGIEHPIISAPMAGVAAAELAAAVSEARGFGLIGGSTGGPDWLRAQIRAVRERTDRPFGVGFITCFPDVEGLLRVALEERVAAVAHSFADPAPYMASAREFGVKVLAQVQTVGLAEAAVSAGVDLIAAQGTEAGGHTGYSAVLPLVPAVVDVARDIPVVAAGGIADGRGMAAALMLGAEGSWIGTRFVTSDEAACPDWVKQSVVEASADDTLLTHSYDLVAGSLFPSWIGDRVLRNEFTDSWMGRDTEIMERQEELRLQIESARAGGNLRVAPVRAGNGSGLIHSVEPAGEIVRRVVEEAEQILRTRPSQVLARWFSPSLTPSFVEIIHS